MHDSGLVGRCERARDLCGNVERYAQIDLRGHQLPQRLPVNELGDDEMPHFKLTDFINGEYVRVVEGRSGARFLLKTQHSLAILSEFLRQQLERDLAPEPH